MAYTLTTSVLPVPQGPTAGISIAGCTSTTTTAPTISPVPNGTVFCARVNQAIAAMAMVAGFGGGTFGVCDGLTVTGAGLNATVAIGRAMIFGPVEVATAIVHACPDATARVYLWVKQDGTVAHTTTTTPPSATSVFIASFPTVAGNIGTVEYSGVVYLGGGLAVRNTADVKKPTDAPNAGTCFLTKCSGNTWLWDGTAYSQVIDTSKQFIEPVNIQTLSGDLVLQLQSPNVQILQASGANRKVVLPAGESWGNWFEIWNVGAANNILVRDPGDTVTLATLTPGKYVARFRPTPDAGGLPVWPGVTTLPVLTAPTAGAS